MDFDLSDELLAVRELGRDFAEKEIAPTAAADDRDHHFRRETFEKMGRLGFFGCVVPEAYGGTGLGYLAMVLLTEEIARVHSSVRVHVNTQLAPAVTLARFGSEAQTAPLDPGAGGCVAHRLFRHHRARRRLRRGFDVHPGRADRREATSSRAPRPGSPTRLSPTWRWSTR